MQRLASVGNARYRPWLVEPADPEMGHSLELASFSPFAANKASCAPILSDIGHV